MADVSKIKLPDQSIVNIKDYRIPGVDITPTSGSSNLITSGGVYQDIEDTSRVVSAALNDLNDRVVDIEDEWVTTEEFSQIEQAVRDTYTKQEIDVMIADLESGGIDNVVTQVKVGATAYNPSNGIVSLPAYPTSLPASDVSSWAKSANKPSYTLDEVSDGSSRKLSNYLPLAGGTMSGTISWPGATRELLAFAPTDSTWKGGLKYSWSSNTTVALWSRNTKGQFVWNAGTDLSANDVNGTSTRTYDFQVGRNASNELEVLTQGKYIGNAFVKSGGTSSQFLKADGSVDSNTYSTTDTKNTAGSTDTSNKIFLIGATSQGANPQTYSDNEVYATSGVLTTKSVQVGGTAATMQYNSTDQSIEFIFA